MHSYVAIFSFVFNSNHIVVTNNKYATSNSGAVFNSITTTSSRNNIATMNSSAAAFISVTIIYSNYTIPTSVDRY